MILGQRTRWRKSVLACHHKAAPHLAQLRVVQDKNFRSWVRRGVSGFDEIFDFGRGEKNGFHCGTPSFKLG